MENFLDYITNVLTKINDQEESIKEICKEIAQRIAKGGTFYVCGTGHSHMVGEEFYARAGGLACVKMIAPMEFTLSEHPLKSTMIERISDYASVVLTQYKITDKDIVMICSNSGRNGLPIELAIRSKEIGAKTIALTSLNHSKNVTSRHCSEKLLYQVCDYLIDNCGDVGDAVIQVDGVRGKMGASSTIAGAYIAQTMGMMIAQELNHLGIEPPVFISANVDNGDEFNHQIMEQYYGI